ncbi:MAG: primosomal replication protein N [Gammaproteobacteria bacterium]
MGDASENTLVITGTLAALPKSRKTPAGVLITRFNLKHLSERTEAGQLRKVECSVQVVVVGEPLARQACNFSEGALLRIQGFLSRAGYKAADCRLELHALNIKRIG